MTIQTKEIKEYPWLVRYMFSKQKKKFGQILIPTMMWGRHPWLLFSFLFFNIFFDRKKSNLDPVLRSLIQVHIAKLNWCKFCIDLNSLNLAERSGSLNKLNELDDWRNSDSFSDQEKAALNFTECMTIVHPNKDISQEVNVQNAFELKKHFSEDDIAELAALISYQNMSAKFNAGLNLPAQGLCEIKPQKNLQKLQTETD